MHKVQLAKRCFWIGYISFRVCRELRRLRLRPQRR